MDVIERERRINKDDLIDAVERTMRLSGQAIAAEAANVAGFKVGRAHACGCLYVDGQRVGTCQTHDGATVAPTISWCIGHQATDSPVMHHAVDPPIAVARYVVQAGACDPVSDRIDMTAARAAHTALDIEEAKRRIAAALALEQKKE